MVTFDSLQTRAVQRTQTDEPTAGTSHLLGVYADNFAAAVRQSFATLPPHRTLIDLLGWRGDDPEWRVPIRETLADTLASPEAFAPFARATGALFELAAVTEKGLIYEYRQAPRRMWVSLVEFVDRCGMLTQLLEAADPKRHPAVAAVAEAYAAWDVACTRFLASRQQLGAA